MSVRCWDDKWVEKEELKVKFPRLFSLSINKYDNIKQVGCWINGR